MGLILDTSALVAWERARNAGHTVTLGESEELVMPAVVWAEALAGVRLADSAARAARRMAWLETLRRVMGVEPFTTETAEHHAQNPPRSAPPPPTVHPSSSSLVSYLLKSSVSNPPPYTHLSNNARGRSPICPQGSALPPGTHAIGTRKGSPSVDRPALIGIQLSPPFDMRPHFPTMFGAMELAILFVNNEVG